MSGADTKPPTLAEMVDREIDRCARALCVTPDLDQCAKTAASLDVLLRYRADAERRERAACPSPVSSLPAWCIVGQRVYHAGKTGEIVASEENPCRITIRYPDADVVMPARDLGYVMPVDVEGRASLAAKGAAK